ncbi:MAG TPA: ATP-grasp domain-containing protein [Sphingomonas sp.]|nr:ATP-grasp domain-containing protein [Sphingomonas sp.]
MESFRLEKRAHDMTGESAASNAAEVRLLLTSAGRRVELMRCFQHEASVLGITLGTLACDLDPRLSPACRLADTMFAVPSAASSSYVDELLDLAAAKRVTMIVPTIDPELLPLSLGRERFAAIGTDVVISGPELVGIARDKLATAEFLAAYDIPSPRTARLEDVCAAPDDWQWPVMVKPRHGSASRGIRIITSPAGLPHDPEEPLIVQELLQGREFTVNMFFDRKGQFRAAVPHERLRVRAGEVEKGITRRDAAIERVAAQLAEVLPRPRGALCFQAFVTGSGDVRVFEINARFGGGYPLAHEAGATFVKWLLQEQAGLPCTAGNDGWRGNLTMLRYDAAVFVTS